MDRVGLAGSCIARRLDEHSRSDGAYRAQCWAGPGRAFTGVIYDVRIHGRRHNSGDHADTARVDRITRSKLRSDGKIDQAVLLQTQTSAQLQVTWSIR